MFNWKGRQTWGPAVVCAAAAAVVLGGQALAEEGARGAPAPSHTESGATAGKATVPQGASGMTVYIDPQTGAIRPDPAPRTPPLQLSPQEAAGRSTSHQGLVEVPAPGGGTMVDLQGRFQSPLVGTIGPDGKLRMRHLEEMPKSDVVK